MPLGARTTLGVDMRRLLIEIKNPSRLYLPVKGIVEKDLEVLGIEQREAVYYLLKIGQYRFFEIAICLKVNHESSGG